MKTKITLLLVLFSCFISSLFAQNVANGREVMIQGFHWTTDASTTKWYDVVKNNAANLQNAGFDAIWLPPPSKSTGGMGYIPTVWYDLNNAQGTQAQLVALITELHNKNIKVLADIVVNHRGGTLGWYDFSTPSWNTPTETWSICNNSNISASGQKGTGNPDYDPAQAGLKSPGTTGLFTAARDLDHSNAEVRNGIKTWMLWLKNQIGFDGWRYDFVHGFDGKYIKEYNDATSPYFSVGELLEGDRNRIVKWLDYTKGGTNTASSTAFDFATKSALQNAFNDNNLSYLKDGSGKASGLIGVWPDKAVTMLDNHDTGPVPYGQDLWIFPGSKVLNGYAYILTHPGTPMVWWPHYFDWGIRTEIDKMIKLRKDNLLSSTSTLNIVAASNNLYAAIIDDKVAMKLGSDNWSPSGTGWTLKISGNNFAIWDKLGAVDVPSLTVSQVGGFFTTGTTVSTILTANNPTSTIYYTLDGTTPTIASPSAVGSITLSINATKTLNAFVRNTSGVNSTIRTETYTFGTLPTFTVYFKKPANWNAAVKVYYWSPTGTAPVVAWPGVSMTKDCGDWYSYTFPSTVSASNLLFNDGTLKTGDLTATAGIRYYDGAWLAGEPANRCPSIAPEVTISPVGGTFTTGTSVNVEVKANETTSTVYYTLDGTTPTTASPSAIGTKSLEITTNTTLKAIAVNTTGVSSAVKTETYTFVTPTTFTVYFKKPVSWNAAVKVYYWGTTGTAPTVAWPGVSMTKDCGDWYSYTFPSTVTASNLLFNDGTLKTADLTATAGIRYYDGAWLAGEPANRCPSIAPEVAITPVGGTFATGTSVNVEVKANETTSTVYYTLDGTIPTTASASAIGTKSLAITTNTTLKAIAVNTTGVSSAVKTETYTFVTPTTFTVYFKKPANWNAAVRVYYWGTTGTAPTVAWPGIAMTKDCGDWYSYTFPSTVSASNLLFNDGTLKTVDLTSSAGIRYYDGAWLAGEPANRCPVQTTMTVYFKPPTTWTTTPKIHYWNAVPAGSATNTTWPGLNMTLDANGFYKYTIVGPTSVNIIFNNGSSGTANQTPDLLNKTDGFSYVWGVTQKTQSLKPTVTSNEILVYPNPVQQTLQISTASSVIRYSVISSQGAMVLEGTLKDSTIDMSSLSAGMYFVKLQLENGEEVFHKIVKK
jgi:Alpha amylase, catalytic domain/Starch-binding module 26/Alpha-amylase C-terminal beta-sheet domain/Chitobiase/beta-hexosaminidase C-terminal domain/Secretion system C-terminal sorting domain